MTASFTLTIVKPDAFSANKSGKILAHLETQPGSHDIDRKKAAVQAAIERARARRAGQP